uniref:Uncharacterized protein n=1 Tax=Zea mays TaxID=4577 RepID=C0PMS1_MAIZE|nr:unknown [Zea mays]
MRLHPHRRRGQVPPPRRRPVETGEGTRTRRGSGRAGPRAPAPTRSSSSAAASASSRSPPRFSASPSTSSPPSSPSAPAPIYSGAYSGATRSSSRYSSPSSRPSGGSSSVSGRYLNTGLHGECSRSCKCFFYFCMTIYFLLLILFPKLSTQSVFIYLNAQLSKPLMLGAHPDTGCDCYSFFSSNSEK